MHSLQVGGLKVSYQKVGKGPLLVLLHGWANTWEAWLPIIPELSDKYTLILPDLPGFGQSEGPQEGWSTQHYSLWLSEFMNTILNQDQSKEWFIAGHSFGGKIAANYCAQAIEPLPKKLILIDASGIPGVLTSKQRALKLMANVTPPFLKKTVGQVLRSKIYKAFDADTDYLVANGSQKKTLRMVLMEDLTHDLEKIEVPTLILWGNDDPATPISAGEIFHKQIEGSEMKVFEAEHFPHHQHPEDVVKVIRAFLEKKTASTIATKKSPSTKGKVKKIVQPLSTLLAVLQQAEYEWPRFQDWLTHQKEVTLIEPKKWTAKLKALRTLVKITSPVFGTVSSLGFWNALVKFPQNLLFSLVVRIARVKLRILQLLGLQVVAIAGSYGKTSTKFIMSHAVSALVPTLMTPDNINTPFGIARVILKDLKISHRLFIAELGEYYPGDIADLTKFLNPSFKILTPIGFAHLERFRTVDRLEKGLLELLLSGKKVLSFVHSDNETLLRKHKVPSYSAFYGEQHISDTSVTRAGTEFSVSLPELNQIFIPLLGRHNAVNVLPTLMLADQLGISAKTVIGKLRTLPHIPHRLEPTLLEHNIFLLDNGYNSNPGSAKQSLAVLNEIEGSQKIVITPGFVEMGDSQDAENFAFGEQLANSCDLVGIVTGANEATLLAGLTKAKFKKDNIIQGSSELEVMNALQPHIKANATILFENSITDVYKRTV